MVAMMVLVVTAWLGSVNALEIDVALASLDSHAEQTLLGQVQYGKSDNAEGAAEVNRATVGSEMQSETGSLAQTVQRDAARGAGSLRVETGGGASETLRGYLATRLESGHETSNVLGQRSAESGHSTSRLGLGCIVTGAGVGGSCPLRCPFCKEGLTCVAEKCCKAGQCVFQKSGDDLRGAVIDWCAGGDRMRSVVNNYGAIESWDVSRVTNMANLFFSQKSCNPDISKWDVSQVTSMQSMFDKAHVFNKDISLWKTAKVTNMQKMFFEAYEFNQDISFKQDSGAWDTSAVQTMAMMFEKARKFNKNIGAWKTSAVTTMYGMFTEANMFNQDISKWNTARVTDMSWMLYSTNFNQNIGSWITSEVTRMSLMFSYTPFNQDISKWNTAKVTTMYMMFYRAEKFNQPIDSDPAIGSWITSKVTDMEKMFYRASKFNQPLNWDTSKVTSMAGMFQGTSTYPTVFNQDISKWNTNAVKSMQDMFAHAKDFNQKLCWTPPASDERTDNFNIFQGSTCPVVATGASCWGKGTWPGTCE